MTVIQIARNEDDTCNDTYMRMIAVVIHEDDTCNDT